jgi:aminoglycoside phosphotransferase (APT) family kinase protein
MQPQIAAGLEAAELIDERPDERLDTSRLAPYLRANLEGAEGPLAVRQFGGGKANLTYLLSFGGQEFVLRRPPLGPIPPGAHDMRREHRVLSALHRRYRPAPRSLPCLLHSQKVLRSASACRRRGSCRVVPGSSDCRCALFRFCGMRYSSAARGCDRRKDV